MSASKNLHSKLTLGGLLISLGIIYGDIGTSPLYVMKAILGTHTINADVVLGGISAVFWTLTLQTTIKYVIITLNADNHGEGGIFALYALVKKTKKHDQLIVLDKKSFYFVIFFCCFLKNCCFPDDCYCFPETQIVAMGHLVWTYLLYLEHFLCCFAFFADYFLV